MRIGLVGCVKGKPTFAAPAADLYVSPLFVGRRRFVEQSCERWFILSALHGLVDPGRIVEPYDQSLVDVSMTQRRAWAGQVLASIDEILGDVRAPSPSWKPCWVARLGRADVVGPPGPVAPG